MATLIVSTFVSLDGVMQDPSWTFEMVEFDPAAYEIKGREQQEAGALLFGRRSYEEFAPVWPTMPEFESYNELPRYVVSSTLDADEVPWGDREPVRVLHTLDDVRRVKDELDAPLLVHGSGTLAKSLAAAGLVDRYHLLVFPVLLANGGMRLFADEGTTQKLTVAESETYGNGITKLVLDVQQDAPAS